VTERSLSIAVVGHTNTGKTSLVRTLTHNRAFGEVQDRGGTTRRIMAGDLVAADGSRIVLFDSPGLENAPELIERLDDEGSGERHDGPQRIRRLLADDDARRQFDHEARVLELMLEVDIALYVIDAREPVLEKYQDELAVLGLCARPIVAVLNFVAAAESREAEWREALARVGLHTVLAFDAAVRDAATERRMFEKLRSQLDAHAVVIDAWLAQRDKEERQRRHAALEAIAAMLLDAAACVREIRRGDEAERESTRRSVRDAIRQRERACLETILELYRFGQVDFEDSELVFDDAQWKADPFDPEALRHYGLSASGYAAVGAGAGAVVDVGTGGLSLGLGTLTGAALGAGTGLVRSGGSRLISRWRGRERLQVDDVVLKLLMARSISLLESLLQRGHGHPDRIRLALGKRLERKGLPRMLRRARFHPEWSGLNHGAPSARDAALSELVNSLDALVFIGSTAYNESRLW
jgi:GTPase Era involved in 16S rRNA processing